MTPDEMRQLAADANADVPALPAALVEAAGEIERMQGERDALREALEAVEFVDDDGIEYCPWCQRTGGYPTVPHEPGCIRQAALKAAGGGE